jgi:YVTN family beta-propeller protein
LANNRELLRTCNSANLTGLGRIAALPFARLLRSLEAKDKRELTPMNASRALRYVWLLSVLAPVPAWAGMSRIYVTNSAGDSIHVIDPSTNKVVQQIKNIEGAHGIAFSPDGSRVYVSDEVDSTLDVFDRKTGKLIKKVTLSAHPNNIAVAKDGRIVVGIARDPGALDIIDPVTLTRTKSVPVNGKLHNVYVTPDGKYVVTGSIRTGIVTVIDLVTEQPVWEVKFNKGIRPMAIEAGPDGATKRIFVQLSDLNGFAVVDFAARKEVERVQLPLAKEAFETDGDRSTAPSHGMGVAPDGKSLWVTSIPNNAVYVYSLADLSLLGEVALPSLKLPGHDTISAVANWVTFTPDSKTVYISNAGLRSVSAIDTKSMKLIAVVPVGEVPKRINTLVVPDRPDSAATSSEKRASLR